MVLIAPRMKIWKWHIMQISQCVVYTFLLNLFFVFVNWKIIAARIKGLIFCGKIFNVDNLVYLTFQNHAAHLFIYIVFMWERLDNNS